MSTFEKIQKVVEAETGETVTPNTRLVTLVTDSLEMANLVLEMEAALGIDLPDEDLPKLLSIQDVVTYAEAH